MRKNLIKAAFVAAFAMVCGICSLNLQKSEILSKIALANVDALAGDDNWYCVGDYSICYMDMLGTIYGVYHTIDQGEPKE